MQKLGASWDAVEVVRSLVTEVESLQKIIVGLEARVQVLEAERVQKPTKPGKSVEPAAVTA